MGRIVDINDVEKISDGRRYSSESMVRLGCDGSKCQSYCCTNMCDTIILDPYDVYSLEKGLQITFEDLLMGALELNVVNGLILPNIKPQPSTGGCGYLDEKGLCTIHDFRPGFCRLFPLARVYDDNEIYYINQIHECPYDEGIKIKVKKWIGTENFASYEKYISEYHKLKRHFEDMIAKESDDSVIKTLCMKFLNTLFVMPYDTDGNFYSQFMARKEILING